MASIINATTTNGLSTSADNSGSLQLATNNGTTAVTIDTSQNVGIGTASPSGFRLNVSGGRSSFNSADDYAVRIGKNGTYGGYIGSNAADVMNFYDSSGNEGFRLNNQTLQMNNGYGSIATFYGCRAWVNFNGTGTVAIRASGNVSSITDDAVGSYTVNLTNAMPDSNYSATLSSGTNSSGGINAYTAIISSTSAIAVYTFSVAGGGSGAYRDTASVLFAVFR